MALVNTLEALRKLVLPKGFSDNHLADGVLFHNGIAIWETPAGTIGGGYTAALRRVFLDRGLSYSTMYTGTARTAAITQTDIVRTADALFAGAWAILDDKDWPGIYAAGSSVVFQNMVFAIDPRSQGPQWNTYQYPEIDALVARARTLNLALYGNIGLTNNVNFPTNDFPFALSFPQGLRPSAPSALSQVFSGNPPVGVTANTTVAQVLGLPQGPLINNLFLPELDTTHPTVVGKLLSYIADIVIRFGVRYDMRFFLPGEQFLNGGQTGISVVTRPINASNCNQAPYRDFSPRALAGFIQYMSRIVGGSETALKARWNTTPIPNLLGTNYSYSKLIAILDCASNPKAMDDYAAYLQMLFSELVILQYATAKRAHGQGSHSLLTFGPVNMESGWLFSDGGATGDFYSGAEMQYRRSTLLAQNGNVARLSGRPCAAAISSPGTEYNQARRARYDCETLPVHDQLPFGFYPRCLTQESFDAYFRDVLTYGVSHIGYVKQPGYSTWFNKKVLNSFTGTLTSWKTFHPIFLRFMHPYQRVALHIQPQEAPLDYADPPTNSLENGLARLMADALEKKYINYSLLFDSLVFDRQFANQSLSESLVLSLFHSGVLERDLLGKFVLLEKYYAVSRRAPALAARSGTVIVVIKASVFRVLLSKIRMETVARFGIYTLWQRASSDAETYFFECPDPPPGNIQTSYVAPIVTAVSSNIVDDTTGIIPMNLPSPLAPLVITKSNSQAEIAVNIITDGMNFAAVITNNANVTTDLTVSVSPKISSRFTSFGSGHFSNTFTGNTALGPQKTTLAYLPFHAGAISESEARTLLAQIDLELKRMGAAGFNVKYGQKLSQYVSEILTIEKVNASQPRTLAGLVRLTQMLYVNVPVLAESGKTITITAATAWSGGPNPAPVQTAVAGCEVDVLNTANRHEQQVVASKTSASGVVSVRLAAPLGERWSFFEQKFYVPSPSSGDTREVHILDRSTGSHCYGLVSEPPSA